MLAGVIQTFPINWSRESLSMPNAEHAKDNLIIILEEIAYSLFQSINIVTYILDAFIRNILTYFPHGSSSHRLGNTNHKMRQ